MFLLFREFDGAEPGDNLALLAEEIRHIKARRLAPGAEIHFGDGRGRRWAGRLEPKGRWKRERGVPVQTRVEPERMLCTALPEGRRWDWLLQKATELGVTRIQPVNFRRSVRRQIKRDRALAVVAEAAAQSRRYVMPDVLEPIVYSQLEDRLEDVAVVYGLHYESEDSGEHIRQTTRSGAAAESAAIIVGPEGGFEAEEVELLRGLPRYEEVRLGENVLRIETAGVAMLARLIV